VSKTLDKAAQAIASGDMVYGRSSKRRESQQADVVRKYRVMYEKNDIFRFYSLAEIRAIFLSLFENKKIPVAKTKGFTPTPKIAFAQPVGAGTSSECEYFDVEINSIKEINLLDLNSFLPFGLQFLKSKEVELKKASLSSTINKSLFYWDFEKSTIDLEKVFSSLNSGDISYERQSKNAILELNLANFLEIVEKEGTRIKIITQKFEEKSLKIEELAEAIENQFGIEARLIQIHRKDQFIEKNGEIFNPYD
jgi:radical SAM-linked protein